MSVLEQKGEILEWIGEIQDETTLERLRSLIGKFLKKKVAEPDWWDELSPEEQADLQEGLREMEDESKWVSHKEVVAEFAKFRKP